jgi:hypothetical protein
MNDPDIHSHIEQLVAEEHRLLDKTGEGGGLDHTEQTRLHEVEVQLDRYYDLLRQRRARREFGQDTGDAKLRPEDVVERYLQ